MAETRDDLPGTVIAVDTQGNTLTAISLFIGFDPAELKQIERSCVWRKIGRAHV